MKEESEGDQDSQAPDWIEQHISRFFERILKHRRKLLLVAVLLSGTLIFLGYWLSWEWVGVAVYKYEPPGSRIGVVGFKSLWDWLDLLIVPIILALGAYWLNHSARGSERKIADANRKQDLKIAQDNRKADLDRATDKQRQDALDQFIDQMSELMLQVAKEESSTLNPSSEDGSSQSATHVPNVVKGISTARTLITLDKLDHQRKGLLIKFLFESGFGSWIDFRGANLEKAGLVDLDLSSANFFGANLDMADLSQTDLANADLSQAFLRGTKFNGAKLIKAKLDSSVFNEETSFESVSEVETTNFEEVNLTRTNLSDVNMKGTILRNCFTDEPERGKFLGNVKLNRANLQNAKIEACNFPSADLRSTNLKYAMLKNCDFSRARMQKIDLRNATLSGVNLQKADLRSADLRDCDLSEADLTDAILLGADFNEETIWPPDFDTSRTQQT